MSEALLASSLTRIQGDLPDFAPGEAWPVKLREGMRVSGGLLKKYVPGFSFDADSAEQTVREIDAWAQRNQAELKALMDTSQNDLPTALQAAFGKSGVQNFLLAGFVTAASGIGPWNSGKLAEFAQAGTMVGDTRVTVEWAENDARWRLQVFGLIVKLENDGKLAEIFSLEASSGLGIPVAVWVVIAIAVVALAAVICGYLYLNKKLELNNKVMADICAKAMAEGDRVTIDKCLEASKELQQGPGSGFLSGLGTLVLCAAGGYLVVKYVFPWAAEKLSDHKVRA
jgi:hypothetical protein